MLPLPIHDKNRDAPPAREQGQDIVEYSLLLALIVVAAVAWFVVSGRDIGNVWSGGGQVLNSAEQTASGNPGGSGSGSGGGGGSGSGGSPGNSGNTPANGKSKGK